MLVFPGRGKSLTFTILCCCCHLKLVTSALDCRSKPGHRVTLQDCSDTFGVAFRVDEPFSGLSYLAGGDSVFPTQLPGRRCAWCAGRREMWLWVSMPAATEGASSSWVSSPPTGLFCPAAIAVAPHSPASSASRCASTLCSTWTLKLTWGWGE